VEREAIRVRAKLCNDERDALSHKPADEMNIKAETIQLRHDDGALGPKSGPESGGKNVRLAWSNGQTKELIRGLNHVRRRIYGRGAIV